ncbi:MAG: hypothetical protein ACFBZ9_04585 [Sphingomonadales bacterium]
MKETHAAAAKSLLAVTGELTALLDEESSALIAGEAGKVEALAGRKAALFSNYQKAMVTVKDLAQPKLSLDDGLRGALTDSAMVFKAAAERNQMLLKGQMETSQSMMQTISAEVQRQQNPVKVYGHPGGAQSKAKPTSLALNQTI